MRRIGLIVIAVGVLLAGCSSPSYTTERLLVAAAAPSGPVGPAPSGTLEYNERGCVSVGGVVLVAPPGSRLIDDGIITLPSAGASARDRQLQVSEAIPSDIRGVRVDRHSRLVPTGYDCGADGYFVIE